MLLNIVQGDIREFQGLGRSTDFFRGNQDVQVLKQGKDPTQSCCAEGEGCCWAKKSHQGYEWMI